MRSGRWLALYLNFIPKIDKCNRCHALGIGERIDTNSNYIPPFFESISEWLRDIIPLIR